jgi:thymidylate synthase ThyX
LRHCSDEWNIYEDALRRAEKSYKLLIDMDWKPEDARGVLNLDVKTEFMMCAYIEDWKMWLFRRLDKHAHPHIQKIAKIVNSYLGMGHIYEYILI